MDSSWPWHRAGLVFMNHGDDNGGLNSTDYGLRGAIVYLFDVFSAYQDIKKQHMQAAEFEEGRWSSVAARCLYNGKLNGDVREKIKSQDSPRVLNRYKQLTRGSISDASFYFLMRLP
ncbi:unnamed protein product [Cochlearia groenlandica]